MRKALIGMVMAATMLTPVAAEAQRGGRGGGDRDRGQRAEQSESGEARAARIEERNERRAARQAQPQPQPQAQAPQPAPQAQAPAQVAQRRGGGDGNRGTRSDRGDRGNRGGQPSIYPQAWQGNPNSPDLRRYQRLEAQNQRRGAGRDDRRDDRRDWRGDRRDDRRDWRDDRRGRGDWNRGWRNDRRYDWNSWRGSNRNIFRLNPYYSPYRNHRYSRFSIGFFLQPLFFSQRYWIGDPWQYRLPPAPYGTQWVRYYGDVLLVDVYTGEVIDVIYDFFW